MSVERTNEGVWGDGSVRSHGRLRSLILLVLATFLLVGTSMVDNSVIGAPAVMTPVGEDAETIRQMLKKLGAEHFAERERNMRRLEEVGEPIISHLGEFLNHSDPEVAKRARYLERRILTGVDHESSKQVVDLVDQFSEASEAEKGRIIAALKQLEEWRAIYGLVRTEKDETTRGWLETLAHPAGRELARQAIRAGDLEMAGSYLRNSLGSSEGRRDYAVFLELMGDNLMPNPHPELLVFSLIEGGEYEKALTAADQAGFLDLAVRLALVLGDSERLLQKAIEETPMGEERYRVARYLMAEKERAKEVLNEWREEELGNVQAAAFGAKRNPERDLASLRQELLLIAIGERKAAIESVKRRLPSKLLVDYYEYHEQPIQFFAALGSAGVEQDELLAWLNSQQLFSVSDGIDLVPETHEKLMVLLKRGYYNLVKQYIDEQLGELEPNRQIDAKMTLISFFGGRSNNLRGQPEETSYRILLHYVEQLLEDEQILLFSAFNSLMRPFNVDPAAVNALERLVAAEDPMLSESQKLVRMLVLMSVPLVDQDLAASWRRHMLDQALEAPAVDRKAITRALLTIRDFDGAWFLLRDEELSELPMADRQYLASHLMIKNDREGFEKLGLALDEFLGSPTEVLMTQARWADESGDELRSEIFVQSALLYALGDSEEIDKVASFAFLNSNDELFGELIRKAIIYGEFEHGTFSFRAQAGTRRTEVEYYYGLLQNSSWAEAAALAEWRATFLPPSNYFDFYPVASAIAHSLFALEENRAMILFARGMQDFAEGNLSRAKAQLGDAMALSKTSSLASDVFFPVLNQYPALNEWSDEWFAMIWESFEESLKHSPQSASTLNGQAWFAAKARRRLMESRQKVIKALELVPGNGATTDTFAEIEWAMGKRDSAIELSDRALRLTPFDYNLIRQNNHFHRAPVPK